MKHTRVQCLVAVSCLVLGATTGRATTNEERLAVLDRNGDGHLVIACLGDSNTSSAWQDEQPGGFLPDEGWCEQLERLFDDDLVRIINRGLGGATVTPRGGLGNPKKDEFLSGYDQLDSVLKLGDVDVVVLAFGTNDVLPDLNGSPESIVDHYNRLFRRGRSRGLLSVVAITPAVFPHAESGEIRRSLPAIAETNQRIAETFAPRFTVDFGTEFAPSDFMDHLHMNAAGQRKRAAAALEALDQLVATEPAPAGVRRLEWRAGHWGAAPAGTRGNAPD